jgi:hypothetical protein
MSETVINFYQNTWHIITEDSCLHVLLAGRMSIAFSCSLKGVKLICWGGFHNCAREPLWQTLFKLNNSGLIDITRNKAQFMEKFSTPFS